MLFDFHSVCSFPHPFPGQRLTVYFLSDCVLLNSRALSSFMHRTRTVLRTEASASFKYKRDFWLVNLSGYIFGRYNEGNSGRGLRKTYFLGGVSRLSERPTVRLFRVLLWELSVLQREYTLVKFSEMTMKVIFEENFLWIAMLLEGTVYVTGR